MKLDLGTVRQLCLAGAGVTFGIIALLAIAFPHAVANAYGLTLDRVEGMNEFRAIFTGFWLSLALAMITAARRPELPLLGDLCAAMLLFQALGRALSVVLDGRPSLLFLGALAGEAMTALTVLAVGVVQKRRAADPTHVAT